MSCTTVFDLNEDCWIELMDYLDVEDQVRLSSLHVCIGEMVKIYASHRYKNIDASLTGRIGDEYLKQLLRIVGEHLVSYESEWDYSSNGDQHLGVLRSHCTNLTQLKMSFRPGRRGWDDLYKLKKLKSLNAYLDMEDSLCTDFVYNLKQFTFLRKLKLNATSYGGRGLHVLDQLESLDVSSCGGFDSMSLVDCCQTMKQLRYLKFGGIRNIRKNSFKSLVTSWKQLECLSFLVDVVDSKFPYELVCQLPKLQHLQVSHNGSLRDSFIEGLMNKRGSPLESLPLVEDCDLSQAQVQHLCNISTL
ncbi:uncharacterized protein [Drosophila pseudoobscura]|uniref:Uncharacterized protein n=1 Tax=Drosophila pseudoobscura pseudoobscura TaxID=46245 RepID=A0A6I8W0K8_DROPS|nr:uncharacterized protein LOC26532971 [Drosophila pseudoobscura]